MANLLNVHYFATHDSSYSLHCSPGGHPQGVGSQCLSCRNRRASAEVKEVLNSLHDAPSDIVARMLLVVWPGAPSSVLATS